MDSVLAGRSSYPDPAGKANRPFMWILGVLLLRGEKKGRGKSDREEEKKETGLDRVQPPFHISGYRTDYSVFHKCQWSLYTKDVKNVPGKKSNVKKC